MAAKLASYSNLSTSLADMNIQWYFIKRHKPKIVQENAYYKSLSVTYKTGFLKNNKAFCKWKTLHTLYLPIEILGYNGQILFKKQTFFFIFITQIWIYRKRGANRYTYSA